MVHCEEISKALRKDTILVSIMHANNEVGAINPIADIGALTRQHGVLFHTDAVQSVGKLPLDVKAMGIDLLSVSAHKLYGPKGIGALYIRQGTLFSPLTYGGAQERGQRAGTENVAGIVGLGKATEICRSQMAQEEAQLNRLRNVLWNQLKAAVPSSILNGHPDKRLPGHLNLSIPGIHGDDLVTQLDLEGFAVSTGSACTSGAVRVSHVLEAMGTVQEIARGAVRISMGRQTTEPDIADLVTAIRSITHRSSA
jgi:cysteine desulfurase